MVTHGLWRTQLQASPGRGKRLLRLALINCDRQPERAGSGRWRATTIAAAIAFHNPGNLRATGPKSPPGYVGEG